MKYSEFVEVYESLSSTTKRLEKEAILAEFLKKLAKRGNSEWIYLLRGRVAPHYDSGEFGISLQLTIKAIGRSLGVASEQVVEKFRKVGDLGEVAEWFVERKKQETLFRKQLDVEKVFENLKRLMSVDGKGSVDRKLGLISELLGQSTGKEAKYIVRTLLGDLRVGIADAVLRDAIAEAFFGSEKKEMSKRIEEAYDLANDFALVFDSARKGKKELDKIEMAPGRALNVMLPVKVTSINEAFRICGKPAAIEHKYDGFRMIISKDKSGEIKLFTRKLENVTKQFPDVVESVKKSILGDSFILDSEAVGYDPKTRKYKPFEAISQRIKRKYDIEKLMEKLPVEVNVFDVLYYNGKSLLEKNFSDRRKIIEKIVRGEKMRIQLSYQIITGDEKVAEKFYKEALKKGEEGIIIKRLDIGYRQGRRVGYIVKLKPDVNDLDLVIIGAEYGTGKRGGWLTSYIVACKNFMKDSMNDSMKDGEFLEVGKVSSGLKELEQEGGTTYDEMTKLLKPLIIGREGRVVKVKPKIVVSVTYQNIQKSPSYSSGYALRFPRITAYRSDRNIEDIDSLKEIEREHKRMQRK